MNEPELRALVEDVRAGTLPRRSFIQKLVGCSLGAPCFSWAIAAFANQRPATTAQNAAQTRTLL